MNQNILKGEWTELKGKAQVIWGKITGDEMDNQVSSLYATKPTRIYLIGKDGRVVFNPGFGPASFNVKHLGKAIENYLTKEG